MKVTLSKIEENEFDYYYSLVSNEKVMAQITERAIPYDEAQLRFQKMIKRNKANVKCGTFKAFESGDNNFIGLGHLTLNREKIEEAEIGYMILPEYWGKGFGTEIARKLIYIAKQTELKILKAIIDPKNMPSRKILINQGFTSEKLCEIEGLPGEILSKQLSVIEGDKGM